LMSLMGGSGFLSVAVTLPIMGARIDDAGPGAALQMVAGVAAVLTVAFAGLWLYFRARGGYRAIAITEPDGAAPTRLSAASSR
jgi:hypothetical protein